MKKFFAALGAIATSVVAAYLFFRFRDVYRTISRGHVNPPASTVLHSEEVRAEYEAEVEKRAKEYATMKAEEALKRWKERFRTDRTSP